MHTLRQNIAWLAWVLLWTSATALSPYRQALDLINSYTPQPLPSNAFQGDHVRQIPLFQPSINDYEANGPMDESHGARDGPGAQIVPLLQLAPDSNHTEALVTLGDIYTFGNFSVATNYSKALEYYHQAISVEDHGHAYFMLGFFYSTGMFGELEMNQGKAQLFYELGLKQGDVNSMLALAYRLSKGIGTPQNCDLALVYYSKLSKLGHKYLEANDDHLEPTEVSYNIRIPDFNGGIYGEDVSESYNSVATSKKQFIASYEQEYSIDNFDRKILLNYFSALDEYDGYYDSPKNYTRAKQLLEECTDYGEQLHGYRSPLALSTNDKYRLSQCQTLLGHMYLKGQGTEKDYGRAYKYLKDLTRLFNTSNALNDLGLIHQNGYVNEPNELVAAQYYKAGMNLGSEKAHKNLAKLLMTQVPHGDLISNTQKPEIVKMMKTAATSGDTEALYLYAEFIQSGYTRGVLKEYSCSTTLIYPKVFLERLPDYFYPHLKYALEQYAQGHYKNALLGYLIAAEQGLEKAQVSAGWLLYQLDPFPLKGKKQYTQERVVSAMRYFKRASDQGDIDSTIFLGDIYFYGVPQVNITNDYEKAFELYSKAANSRSPHGCFSLAYMYEHGLGVVNNSIDYFMAKRYYDLSLKYKDSFDETPANKIPIYFTLLKLRLKYLFSGLKKPADEIQTSWFSTFKKLGNNQNTQNQENTERSHQRAREQHEGDSFFVDDDMAIGDYFVLGITISVFLAILVRNLLQHYRRIRNGNNNDNENEGRWNWNVNGANFRRGNFEFHFFAL